MRLKYDKDTNLLEVIEPNVKNYGEEAKKSLTIFYSVSDDRIIGFNLFDAINNKNDLICLPIQYRLICLLRILREEQGLTQGELSVKTRASVRVVQKVEAGEINITFGMLSCFVEVFPNFDFTLLLKSFGVTLNRG